MNIKLVISYFIFPFLLTFLSFWTYFKARELKEKGIRISPLLWAFLVWAWLGLLFPLFLLLKKLKWEKETKELQSPPKLNQKQRILVIILFFVVYFLSFLILIELSPIPSQEYRETSEQETDFLKPSELTQKPTETETPELKQETEENKFFPAENEFLQWETYKNEDLGIEFKYLPSELESTDSIFTEIEDSVVTDDFKFVIFYPKIDSLEKYLNFYADKKGGKLIKKKTREFGDIKKGIFYTIELSSEPYEQQETGYIFHHGPATFHFMGKKFREEISEEFLETLASLKVKKPKINKKFKKSIYENEKYGIRFNYPPEWGSLALDEIIRDINGSKIYHFLASGEKISEVYYHTPSNQIAFIEKSKKYKVIGRRTLRQDKLQVYKDGKIIKTFSYSPPTEEWVFGIFDVDFSPNGKYIYFDVICHEWGYNPLFNIENGTDIIANIPDPEACILFYPYRDVLWSPNGKILAIKSWFSAFSGEGVPGIFVSDYGNPEKLNLVFDEREKLGRPDLVTDSRMKFIDEEKLFFELKYQKNGEEKSVKYEYNARTKELKELK